MKSTLIIRHAESEYNLAQRLAKQSVHEVKLEDECQITKYSPKLMDAPLTPDGIKQCENAQALYKDLHIELVVTSPLRRAVQTAYILFKDHPNKPKFIAEPYLREMQLSSCDIGSRLSETMADFPMVDFSRLQDAIKNPNMWSLEFTQNKDRATLAKQYIMQRTENYNEEGPALLAEYMASGNQVETFEENDQRVRDALKYLKFDVPFVCVSHSRTINALTQKWIKNYIESQRFDCQRYVSHFLKQHSVQDLIKRHNELQHEIKDYDQEIQSLVFENYSKFIASIDTVKKMKCDITKIDSKMETLAQSMGKISQLSRRVDTQLSVKRDEIIKLDTVNKDLSKLNNVCQFPHIIQQELDAYRSTRGTNFDEYFIETANYYKQCFPMLEKYKNEPLIQPIHKETTQKLENVRQILWNALMEFKQQNPLLQLYQESKVSISTQEARSAVKKLICIMDDEEAVLRHYQKIIKERYLTVAKELIDKAAISKSQEVVNLLEYLEERQYEYTVEDLEEYKQTKEKEFVHSDATIQGSILWLINQLCQIVFKELKAEVSFLLIEIRGTLRDKSLEQLSAQCIKDIINGVFQGVTDKMSQKKINNVQVNEVFVKLQYELQSLFENSSIRQQLKTEIIDKFAENVENICRGQVFTSFSHLRVQFLELLVFAKNDLQKHQPDAEIKREIMTLITVIKQKLIAYTTIRLLDLKAFVFQQQQSYLREQDTYLNLIQASLIEFVKFIAKIFAFRSIGMSQEQLTILFTDQYIIQQVLPLLTSNDTTQYYLFANQFLQLFQKTLSDRLLDLIKSVFPSFKGTTIRQPTEQEINKLKLVISNSQQKNLMLFAQTQSEHWINEIFNYLQTRNVNYQQQVSEKQIYNEVISFIEALGLLFPDTKRGLVKKLSMAQQSSFNIQMQVVMVRKCRILETTIHDRNTLLQTVVKYFLKVLLLRVRRTLFNEDMFKQFQIDLYFVIQLIYELVSVDEEGLIAGFYSEILDGAAKNCQSDSKVDSKIIEQLSNQVRND